METETEIEQTRQINEIKLLYEDFYKTTSNFIFNDVEILVLDYLIERSKEGELDTNDENISNFFNFDKKALTASLITLSKSKIIEIKKKTIGIIDGAPKQQNQIEQNAIKVGKKTQEFYRLNSRIKEEFPIILEKYKKFLEKDLQFDYYCPSCKANYKTEDVYDTNPKLEPGKFLCINPVCRTYLREMSEEETNSSNASMNKIKNVIEIIQFKFDLIKQKDWPFKKKSIMNENNIRADFLLNNGKGGGDLKEKIELEESNKESWVFKMFKMYYLEKYKKHFEDVNLLKKSRWKDEEIIFLSKLKENQKIKSVYPPEKILNQQNILKNRKRFADKSDLEYEKIYKYLKK